MSNHFVPDDPSDNNGTAATLPAEFAFAAQWYTAQPRPQPALESTNRLLARLSVEEIAQPRAGWPAPQSVLQTMRVTRWQLYLLSPWYWISSTLLLLLGGGTAAALAPDRPSMMLIYILPLTAILTVVYALRRMSPGLRDVEVSCPTGHVETTAGLVIAIVCFDILLGLVGTFALELTHGAAFEAVLASWLGPLLLLVGLSFPVALRRGTLPAIVVGGGPWLALVVLAELLPGSAPSLLVFVGQDSLSLAAHLMAAMIGALILGTLFFYGSTWQNRLTQA